MAQILFKGNGYVWINGVTLMHGGNNVSEAQLKALEGAPRFQEFLKNRTIEILGIKQDAPSNEGLEEEGGGGGGTPLAGLSKKEALELILNQKDLTELEEWARVEKRKSILVLVLNRIEEVKRELKERV